MREAGPDDIPIVIGWINAFAEEALDEAAHLEGAEAAYRRREADPDGAWLLWDDEGPVSLAAYGSPTPNGTRVGPVYTPPELRGRGYATSLVAELTEQRLAAGLRFCFLFTDLGNPTSNAIYARIGYEPWPTGINGRSSRFSGSGSMPIQTPCQHGSASRSA